MPMTIEDMMSQHQNMPNAEVVVYPLCPSISVPATYPMLDPPSDEEYEEETNCKSI